MEFIIGRGINIVFIAMLARLLTPEDFGTFALLAIFVGVTHALVESGFGQALIHFQDTTDEDNSTVFWTSLGTGTFLSLCLYFTAPYIAAFFETDVLVPLTHIMAITIWISAFGIVQRALLIKQLAYRKITIVNLSALLFASLTAVILASLDFGVYTLAWQALCSATLTSGLLWLVNGWRPKFQFRLGSAKRLFGFGGYLLAAQILEVSFSKTYTLLIGKFYSTAELGQFNRAETTATLVTGLVVHPIQRIAFPVFSKMQNDRERMRTGLQGAVRVSMLFNAVAMLTLAVAAGPFVLTMFGPQWEASVPFLQVLCIYSLLMPLHFLNLQALMALGRSDLFFLLEVIKKVFGIAILIAGSQFGPIGIAWGLVISGLVSFVINSWYSGIHLNYGPVRQALQIIPSLCFGAIAAGAAYLAMTASGLDAPFFLLIVAIAASAAMSLTMLGLAWLFGHDLTGLLPRSRALPVSSDRNSSA